MANPTNRSDAVKYCLRKLGHPGTKINLDQDQIDDAMDDAIDYMRLFHHNATERIYLAEQVTDGVKANGYFTMSESIRDVVRIFPLTGASTNQMNLLDVNYQFRLNDMYNFNISSVSMINWVMVQMHLRLIEMLMVGETEIRFNYFTQKLYIDTNWSKITSGQYMIAECYIEIDPTQYPKFWSDRRFLALATEYTKLRWGQMLKKFGNVAMMGGIVLNGQQIYEEADVESKRLEDLIRSTYEPPPEFIVG
jgi:hypothetical protein